MSDSDFDVKWRAFAEDDARVEAPSSVRRSVMAAWDAARQEPAAVPSRMGYLLRPAVAVAASAVLLAAGLWMYEARQPQPHQPASVTTKSPETFQPVQPNDPSGADAGSTPQAAVASAPPAARAARRRPATAAPIVRLTADPAYEAEALQLVRLRMPRASLEVFGLALLEPDASRLVDVDVVIGGDGLPRDIRRIRPVLEPEGLQ